MSRDSRTPIALTRRAIQDLRDILNFSTERWGRRVADKYLDELDAGLNLLREHPDLLAKNPDFLGVPTFTAFKSTFWFAISRMVPLLF